MAFVAAELAEGVASSANPEIDDLRLGIVGAGKFGTTLARAAVAAASCCSSSRRHSAWVAAGSWAASAAVR